MTTPAEVVTGARSWLGVPFRHQGRNRRGVDCLGLVIVVAQELGLLPPEFERSDYGRLPFNDELLAGLRAYCEPREALAPGCMIAMRWSRQVAHVGIFSGDTVIHAYEGRGQVIEHGLRGRWLRFVDSAWAFPGVTYE